ncbi:MAG: glycoside hydrolase family 2 [Oscillospiraceae bacterium]|nr:glycoside hydrolase family 2 [Oscillospiraceae bacterium]
MRLAEYFREKKVRRYPNARLCTRWGKTLDREHPLPEYPRPQFRRNSYMNLNGVWEYAIAESKPKQYQGEIVVPFSPESLLSGVGQFLNPTETLFYRRTFTVDNVFLSDVTYLHFGAVDCDCTVTLNGAQAGSHSGGFLPFSLDVTGAIHEGENEICVAVTDPTDTSWISRGKQSSKPGGIWYTPQSGIWQTVWLESVPKTHIKSLKITPDIDAEAVRMLAECTVDCQISAVIFDGENEITSVALQPGVECFVKIPEAKLWSPESPFLYNVQFAVAMDIVHSYFGMRKFSIGFDENGVPRLCLNNRPYFHNGLLDQGYWSDGLLTAPDDAAMVWDIEKMKQLGFNMLRKHIKIEPARWYYHCDRLGMLVWQDMVNGGGQHRESGFRLREEALPESECTDTEAPAKSVGYSFNVVGVLPFRGKVISDGEENYARFSRSDAAGRESYWRELAATVAHLQNCVSIAMWVPFNEGWGQFDANAAAEYLREHDPSRTVDHASGWHDQGGGDVVSLHVYFKKLPVPKFENGKWNVENAFKPPQTPRALVLSEFGGYSYHTPGHVYNPYRVFGYRKFKSVEKFRAAYQKLYRKQLQPMIDAGLSAAVYTQLSDVEDETNGLVTFDREVCKL